MNPASADDVIIAEITTNAPADRVFEALTDPKQLVQWWGAEGRFQATHVESDLRPGGAWVMRGTGTGGKPFTIRGQYLSIERPRFLESTWIADWHENESPTTVRFDLEERNGQTLVRLTHSGFATASSREGYKGWPWLLSLLKQFVETRE